MSHPFRFKFLLITISAAALLFAGAATLSGATGKDAMKDAAKKSEPKAVHAQDAAAQGQAGATYVGMETCMGCHEEVYKKYETTAHWRITLDKSKGAQAGCESCHGPGSAHVEGGGDKTKIYNFAGASASEVAQRCLSCHLFTEEQNNFGTSVHNLNDVSCLSCHSVHAAKVSQKLLKASQPALCYSCHSNVRPQFERPFKHRVNEGLLKCSDCHNQHGSLVATQLRTSFALDQVCFKCHADKAGPFVFEHAAVKVEGCMACHLPHGSSNPRLLRRNQVNLLCLECHTLSTGTADPETPGIPSFHNQSQKYQACTMCHTAVHGSNFSSVFFK